MPRFWSISGSGTFIYACDAGTKSAKEAAGKTVTYIMEKVAEYKKEMAKGQEDKAYEAIGMAMHPLMDNTSPSHEGFQEGGGIFPVIDGTTKKAYIHGQGETESVFNSKPGYSSRAVDAIRKVSDDANR